MVPIVSGAPVDQAPAARGRPARVADPPMPQIWPPGLHQKPSGLARSHARCHTLHNVETL
eukprot:1161148-Pelagomonas_calceolata.AAC.1